MKKQSKFSNEKNNNPMIITFWSMIGLVTIIFLVMLIFVMPSRQIKSLSKITHLKMNEVFTQGEEAYYVYIYDSSNLEEFGKNHNLKPIIINYANFAKSNANKKGVYKIYRFDVNYPSNQKVKSSKHSPYGVNNFDDFTVDVTDLPILITIEGNKIQDRKTKELDIEKELGNRMADVFKKVSLNNWVAILDKNDFLL